MTLNIGIVAGEASGDNLGAGLIQALRRMHPKVRLSGIGGPAMIQSGFDSLYDLEELAVMGILDPLRRLPRLVQIRRELYRYFTDNRPDVFIGIDSPDFNIGLELKLRQQGIRTVHYVSPSVWAWRRYRIHKIVRAVDLMLTLLPFEAEFYKKHNVPVKFVGHPLADKISMRVNKLATRSGLGLGTSGQYIALLPGSRKQELRHLGKRFLKAALICYQQKPELRFITSSINTKRDHEWRELHQAYAPDLPLAFYVKHSHEVMAAADAILVTSGTATLESMLLKKPMVIAYHTATFNFMLAKLLVRTPFIGLPNLLAHEAIVPELIQTAAKPQIMANLLLDYLDHPEKARQLQDKFLVIHQELSQNADYQAAKAVFDLATSQADPI